MIKWLLKKCGYIPVAEYDRFIEELDKLHPIPLPSTSGEVSALCDPKEEAYKIAVFKEVFNNKKGRLVLDFLKAVYSVSIPNFEHNTVNYFNSGKLRAVTEIEIITNKQPKKKEEEKE